jgi:hypothetical protein
MSNINATKQYAFVKRERAGGISIEIAHATSEKAVKAMLKFYGDNTNNINYFLPVEEIGIHEYRHAFIKQFGHNMIDLPTRY